MSAQVILDAAEYLFLQKGYSSTSVREIAQRAGYAVANIYCHFSSKEQIFATLLEERAARLSMTPVIGDSGNTTEVAFLVIFQRLLEFIRRNEGFFRLIVIDYLELNALHLVNVAAQWNVVFDELLSCLEPLENIRQDISPAMVLRILIIQAAGYYLSEKILPRSLWEVDEESAYQMQIMDMLLTTMSVSPSWTG